MTATVTLPARLDLTTARQLARELHDHAGRRLTLDASGVESLGGLGLQVLLAAAQDWRRQGAMLDLGPCSAAFDAALAQFGLTRAALQAEGSE